MRNYFIALCLLLLAGCTKADVESVSQQKINSQKFHAEFAEDDTRTFVDEKVRLLWTEGDLLTIFTSTLNRKYQFDGETGDNSGTFSEIATSQFGTGNSISANYAVYPYSSSNKISNDEVITLSLPATQQYAEGSFGQDANTMVAVTSGPNDYFLPFKNVGGFLRLRLYGEGVTIKCIELKGNNSEKIAGKATVTAKYGQNPELEMSNSATESITLDCGDGVALGATAAEAKDFWIVVPPTTFTKGFTITITDTAGATMEKSTTKSYVVERNVLKSMTAFEVEILDANTPPNNQIWYTSTDGKIVTPKTDAFGVNNIISNVYENGKGVITFDGDIAKIGKSAFMRCDRLVSIDIPNSITEIEAGAFISCGNLTNIDNILDNIISIGAQAFMGCSGLTSVKLPNSITSLGGQAFCNCTSLTSIDIPESLTSISTSAFAQCYKLETVKIPNSITTIEKRAFKLCESLQTITIPNGITEIGDDAFQWCKSLTTVNLPESVTSFGTAFSYCESLTKINIPSNVMFIASNAFRQCKNLTEIIIPNGITSIGNAAFYLCENLASIDIAGSVNAIGSEAFKHCKSLSIVNCKPITPPTLFVYAFVGTASNLRINVPINSVDAYKAADNWKDYAEYIEGYEF